MESGFNCEGSPSQCDVVCGDGLIIEGIEVCDDENTLRADGCSRDCREVEFGFECVGEPSVCSATCGDSLIRLGEECDDGNQSLELCAYGEDECEVCNPECQWQSGLRQYCGDSVIQNDFEDCDDGNQVNGDGCSLLCRLEIDQACGNSLIEEGEECDDGNQVNTDACTNQCQNAFCGDGIVRQGEEDCDDGNQINGDGCSNECLLLVEGACFNEADQVIVEDQMAFGDQLLSLVEQNCALYVLLNQLHRIPQCLSSVLITDLGLSVECSACLGDFVGCGVTQCVTACSDGLNQTCQSCLDSNGCTVNLVECAGPIDLSEF